MSITENIATKLTAIAENVPQVYQSGLDDGFVEGWFENETNVIGGLENSVQKVENYTSVECEANDSGGMIRYIDENIPTVYESGKNVILNNFDGMYGVFSRNQNMNLLPYVLDADLSNINSAYNMFQANTLITEFHAPKTLKPGVIRGMFYDCTNLVTVSGLADPEDTETVMSLQSMADVFRNCSKLISAGVIRTTRVTSGNSAFSGCVALQEIEIVGTIEFTGLSFGDCVALNKKSITSIINALDKDASGKAITFNKTAVNNAFGINVDDESTYPEGSEYYTLRHSKDNWTFSYV